MYEKPLRPARRCPSPDRAQRGAACRDPRRAGGGGSACLRAGGVRGQVTRGALYHHFADKQDLFAAVFEDVSRAVVRRIAVAAGRADDPWAGFVAGHDAFLDACLNAEVRRILVIDGVAVLGTHRWRELDLRFTAGSLLHGVRAVQFAGYLPGHDPELLAGLLSGALNDAAIMIDQAPDPAMARARIGAELHRLLDALRDGATGKTRKSPTRPSRRERPGSGPQRP